MLLSLLALLACGAPDTPEGEQVVPEASVAGVRQGVQAAHRAWSAGDLDEASALVMRTYQASFQPLEPALRATNPAETLALEYSFGVLSWKLSRKGNPVAVAAEVRDFVSRIEAAGAAAAVAQGVAAGDPTMTAPRAPPAFGEPVEVSPALEAPPVFPGSKDDE